MSGPPDGAPAQGPERPIAPVGVLVGELTEVERVDLGGMPRWHLTVLDGGSPIAQFELPSPGAGGGAALAAALIGRRTDESVARRRLAASLSARLGAEPHKADEPMPSCSVVVCTHRRPHYVPTLLAALAELDPAPTEIIVVDNDPGEADCREQVAALGARYVREDRRGLDNARNAGVRAARGDIVVFTDDDCVPSRGWLKPLATGFDRGEVAALTGPAFPFLLDTPARVRVEEHSSLSRGIHGLSFDWRSITPAQSGVVGVGANMAIRRDLLLELGPEPFPPELDAGTPTESGGDTALFAALLADGRRIVYDPDMFVQHQHRPDWPALEKAIRGYGIGLSAALSKLVLEDGELSAPRAWRWLIDQYLGVQVRRFMGTADAVSTRIAFEYVRGGFIGTAKWRRSRAEQAAYPTPRVTTAPAGTPAVAEPQPATAEATADPAIGGSSEPAKAPAISVVVPTAGRREEALTACLAALAGQRGEVDFELVLVDDGAPASLSVADFPAPLTGTVIATGGRGAAEARNAGARAARGDLLVFVDDDVIAEPDMLAAHRLRHAETDVDTVVVGPYMPRPRNRSLAANTASLWWSDFFAGMENAMKQTFVSVLTGNLSVPRATFLETGGFDESLPSARREDWEWGLRLLEADIPIEYEPQAAAFHEFDLSTAGRLNAARLEGIGDAAIADRYPSAVGSLPVGMQPGGRWSLRLRLAGVLWKNEALRRQGIRLLALLERAKLRKEWWTLFNLMQGAAYAQGLSQGGCRLKDLPAPTTSHVPLDRDDPIPPPRAVAPTLRISCDGLEVGRLAPIEGQWSAELGGHIAERVPWSVLGPLAADRGWIPRTSDPHGLVNEVDVLLQAGSTAAARLAGCGASVLDVSPGEDWWNDVVRLVRGDGRSILAIPLPGLRPDPRWLHEALVAFEASDVAVAVGGSAEDRDPLAPVLLRDDERVWRSPAVTPLFLMVRRELASRLLPPVGTRSGVGCLLATTARAVAEGWVVAHRDVHGLTGQGPSRLELGRAWGAEIAFDLLDPIGPDRGTTRGLRAARAGVSLVHETARALRHGDRGTQQQLTGAALGIAAGLRRRDRS